MIAVVPTIGLAPQLRPLVDQLVREGVEEVILTVNEPGSSLRLETWWPVVHRVYVPGSIYTGWNLGLRRARRLGQTLAVLNDDVELEPGALAAAEKMMRSDPSVAVMGLDHFPPESSFTRPGEVLYCAGTYQHNGVPGWAFLADPTKVSPVDERFEWWYGDDDLVRQAIADGHKVAVAGGARVKHQGEASAAQRPWTHEAKIRDAARFAEKWGD